MGRPLREEFADAHRDVALLEAGDAAGVEAYLRDRGLVASDERPLRIARAGAGNMNLTLRVTLPRRTFILKQGRPWVEKYDHIAAPWERTLIEGRFYEAVRGVPAVAGRMPELLALDPHNHVIVLEDAGTQGDFTSAYADGRFPADDLRVLLEWLSALARVTVPEGARGRLANRGMRALNHEHIFRFPLDERNGLELDGITEGLTGAAAEVRRDRAYVWQVARLGREYLADHGTLVHGDYFPGSWVRSPDGIRVIDPEFCFLGAREFDYGVMVAHLALALVPVEGAREVLEASVREGLDERLVLGFAGVEIMRRLIGVAQVPVTYGLDRKRRLLDLSRSLVLAPEAGLKCW